jgi:hypothetical protein
MPVGNTLRHGRGGIGRWDAVGGVEERAHGAIVEKGLLDAGGGETARR